MKSNNSLLSIAVVFISALFFLWQFPFRRRQSSQEEPNDPNLAFQDWFRHKGGWMSPNLSLASSADYYGNGLVVSRGNIRRGDVLLEIPRYIIMTKEMAMHKFSDSPNKDQKPTLLDTMIQQTATDALDQQDVWIALLLMLECAMGRESAWYPYLKVLPVDVPRLATFTDHELIWLQDDNDMAQYGSSQRQMLSLLWRSAIEGALSKMSLLQNQNNDHTCWTETSFHRFVALSSSRAMILENGIKYLTPMAEMINHANRPVDKLTTTTSKQKFHDFHKLDHKGEKLVIYADRDFLTGDMIVEEYGQLDNSLYISAFGFVPLDNPHHCVLLPLPNPDDGVICVGRDGRIQGSDDGREGSVNDRILENVPRNVDGTDNDNRCDDKGTTNESCESTEATAHERVRAFLRTAARTKLAGFPTSIDDDVQLLRDLESMTLISHYKDDAGRTVNNRRMRIALQFRMEEKKVLHEISSIL